jgi:hypothetical protein
LVQVQACPDMKVQSTVLFRLAFENIRIALMCVLSITSFESRDDTISV